MTYNPQPIEKKRQEEWEKAGVFKAKDLSKKKKYYILVEFPYPSGEGLHVGHCRSYIGLDILARKKRMQGFNVLFPMGWDAFGLPTENYAIKTGIHPAVVTEKNTSNFRSQAKSLGLSFDWAREINTTNPSYYKWTQWIFIQLFKKGLAYKARIPINWCPSCKIGLANEEVVNSCCERCGAKVAKKEKEQWLLKITEYADRLIEDLNKIDYPERVKISQKEWIGKSEGWEIEFRIMNSELGIKVFTTRVDTLFGCTYLVLSPEHPIIKKLKSKILNFESAEKYIDEAKKKTEIERVSEVKNKKGIELKGITAFNPANNREIPIFVADYVLLHYGTGAIMAVPCHDQRDFDFAQRYNLPMVEVIKPFKSQKTLPKKPAFVVSNGRFEGAYEEEGFLVNSGRFNGLSSQRAKERIGEWLEKQSLAKKSIHYKLKDWVFSRQRYWGEPIPMANCQKCGWQPLNEKDLPLELPSVKKYKPTEEGHSPLAAISEWINTTCPKCGEKAVREADVMPNWAGSNWYYLRYCDPGNDKKLADVRLLKYWMPVDWYNGGMEHVTLHLLYSRFIYKFLWDIKAVPQETGPEPYKKRTSHGMILGEGGIKMSKSKGNVVNPSEIVKKYGADTMRIYEMFIGPFDQMIPWEEKGIKGVKRFLERIWNLQKRASLEPATPKLSASKTGRSENQEMDKLFHSTIKKIEEDVENLKFNTAISCLMILLNKIEKEKSVSRAYYSTFLILLSPFAPHIAEELWSRAGFESLCCSQKWPKYDPKLTKKEKIILIIQINGKIRDKIELPSGFSEKEARELALFREKVKKIIGKSRIKKVIFVPDKLINIVI